MHCIAWNNVPPFLNYIQKMRISFAERQRNKNKSFDLFLFENLPDSLEELILNDDFDLMLNDLPNSIKFIKLPESYDKPLLNIPINLKTIKCSKDYKFIENLTNLNIEYY